jgi:prepilin-type N-terminal cleavage/methylation domain-containing protein
MVARRIEGRERYVVSRLPNLRGFTLLELIMVIMVISLLASLALPRFASSQARHRAEAGARRVSTDLELAQRHARTTSTSVTVTFDTANEDYLLAGVPDPERPGQDYRVYLERDPYQIDIVAVDFDGGASVTFDGYGLPDNPGAVLLRAGEFDARVGVALDTARITREVDLNGALLVEVDPNTGKLPAPVPVELD